MQELDRRIASLKLRLAEIEACEQSFRALRHQYRQQLRRAVDIAIWAEHPLDVALAAADEVRGRLDAAERSLDHLRRIRARAEDELRTLRLTRSVDDAKRQLADLQRRRRELVAAVDGPTGTPDLPSDAAGTVRQIDAEIDRLHRLIEEASEEAARHIARAQADDG